MIVDVGDGVGDAVRLQKDGLAGEAQDPVQAAEEQAAPQLRGEGIAPPVFGQQEKRFRQIQPQGGVAPERLRM